MDLENFNLLETPWALVEPGTLRVRFANTATLGWLGLGEPPRSLTEALPELASPRAEERLKKGRAFSIDRTIATRHGQSTAVEYRLRPAEVAGERLLILEGFDQSKVQAKQAILEQFSRMVDTNNKQLARQGKQLDLSNQQMHRVLDNVEQGLLLVAPDGTIGPERSRILDAWFGAPPADASFFTYLGAIDASLGLFLRLGWEAILDGLLPLEVNVDQLPSRFEHGEKSFAIRFRPLLEGEVMSSMLVVISDVSERIARERAERAQRETVAIFRHMTLNRVAFGMFHDEVQSLIAAVTTTAPDEVVLIKRQIHTLKGNCAMFGIKSVAVACHEIETRMSEMAESISPAETEHLRLLWSRVVETCEQFGRGTPAGTVELEEGEYASFVEAVRARIDHRALTSMVASWRHESAARRLDRLGEQMQSLAAHLGRPAIELTCAPTTLRLPPKPWAPFWSVFVHVLRNALDHGIELPDEREAAGKPPNGRVALAISLDGDDVVVAISDDGRGIAWSKIAEKAGLLGLPVATEADLVEAMFADSVSSRDEVTMTSGRGVGMGAVRAVVRALGGRIEVESAPGKGTTFRFLLPSSMLREGPEPPAPAVSAAISA